MELVLTIIACISLPSVGALTFLLARHLNTMRFAGGDLVPAPVADRYRPMLRLLSEDDFSYLASGGWTRSMLRRARADRRRLFRVYLRSLVKDYSRLLAGLRARLTQVDCDRPDLARALARNRFLFTTCLLKIEVSLALNAIGIGGVDVSGLVQVVEALRGQNRSLAQLPTAV